MLKQLVQRISERAQAKMAGAAKCPHCQESALHTGETYSCRGCGFVGAFSEFVMSTSSAPTGKVGHPPAETKIVRRKLPTGGIAFTIPASGRSGGLLPFGILWTAITALATIPFVITTLSGKATMDFSGPPWLATLGTILFFGLFWGIGLGMLYFGLRAKHAVHVIRLEHGTIDYVRGFAGRRHHTQFPFEDVESIAAKAFYERNYHPVIGIEIRGTKKKVRFGTSLTDAEKGWLVAECNALVFPKPAFQERATDERPRSRPRHGFERILAPERNRLSDFITTTIGFLVVGGFLILGFSPLMADAGFFRVLWIGFSLLFLLVMLGGIVWGWRRRRMTVRVLYDGKRVTVSKEHGRHPSTKESVPVEDLLRVAYYPAGASNQEARYSGALITKDRCLPLFRWRREDQTRPFIDDLRRQLQLKERGLPANI